MICDDRWFFFEATSQSTALSGPSNKISTKTPTLCRVAELEPKSHQPNLSHLSYSKSLFCHSLFQVWSCLLPLVLVICFTLRKTPGLRSPRHSLQEEPRTQMVTLPQKVDVRGCGWPRTVARTNHMNLSCSKNKNHSTTFLQLSDVRVCARPSSLGHHAQKCLQKAVSIPNFFDLGKIADQIVNQIRITSCTWLRMFRSCQPHSGNL